ncbi:MAG: hypothetical protein HYY84_04015 [Deltaproteobacteria bacterium]|nr:hypothetical protein [Deltaproteobacteria bacterium]
MIATWSRSFFEPSEVEQSLDAAFLSVRQTADIPTVIVRPAVAPWEVRVASAWECPVFGSRPIVSASEPWIVDDEFVVCDEAAGAHLETTAGIIEALKRLLEAPAARPAPRSLDNDLAPHVPHLDVWEIEAFRSGETDADACIRTMVAERLRIITFDASRRREVGRDAAMRLSMAYLDETSKTLAMAQAVANDLIRKVNVAGLRNLSTTRAKLFATAAELRAFIAHVQSEIAGDVTNGDGRELTNPFGSAAEVAFFSENNVWFLDAEMPPAADDESVAPNVETKSATRSARTKRARQESNRRIERTTVGKLVVFASTLLMLISSILYFVLDHQIAAHYRDRAPDFAEFDAKQFTQVLPIQSATKIRDVADVVVRVEWPDIPFARKQEKVGALFNILRPSGVSQLYVFDQARQMVASCKNGVVTVIR